LRVIARDCRVRHEGANIEHRVFVCSAALPNSGVNGAALRRKASTSAARRMPAEIGAPIGGGGGKRLCGVDA